MALLPNGVVIPYICAIFPLMVWCIIQLMLFSIWSYLISFAFNN